MTLYRIEARTTGSLQPGSTFWARQVLYCGDDRDEARRVYHASAPEDYGGSYGNRCRRTVCEIIADEHTEDFADDTVDALSGF